MAYGPWCDTSIGALNEARAEFEELNPGSYTVVEYSTGFGLVPDEEGALAAMVSIEYSESREQYRALLTEAPI